MAGQLLPPPKLVLPTYLRKSTIIPEIAVMREAIANVSELTLLDVLLDGVHWFLFRYLHSILVRSSPCNRSHADKSFELAYFHLCVSPSWDFDNHIQHRLLLVGIQRNVMER